MLLRSFGCMLALASVVGCAGGAVSPGGYSFPSSVMADRLSFGVSRGPLPQSFMLNMKISLNSATDQPEAPPTDAQWQKAAEQALPAGCKITEVTPSETGEALVKFSC